MNVRRLFVVAAVALFMSIDASHAQGTTKTFTLVREARIGANDGSRAELTGFPRPVLAPDGELFVYSGCEIRRFDHSGRYVENIGRCGDGPMEFRRIAAMGFLGDSVWIVDRNHHRLTILQRGNRNATTLEARYTPQHPALGTSAPSALLRGGIALAQGELVFLPPGAPNDPPVMSPLVRMNRRGAVLDTVATLLARNAPDITLTFRNAWLASMRQPYVLQAYWAARNNGEGFAIVEYPLEPTTANARISVRVFDASGKQTFAREIPYTPKPLPANIREKELRAIADEVATGPAANEHARVGSILVDALMQQLRTQTVWPRFLPPVLQLLVGDDGSIWIMRESQPPVMPEWLVLDGTGVPIGRMVHPKGMRIAYADLRQVVAVENDGDDIPWVVKLRVVR